MKQLGRRYSGHKPLQIIVGHLTLLVPHDVGCLVISCRQNKSERKPQAQSSHKYNKEQEASRYHILRGDFGRVSMFCLSLRKTYSVKNEKEKILSLNLKLIY